MTQSVFIQSGHGYETGSYGRCTAFDGFEIIAEPLPGLDAAGRESRVFNRQPNGNGGTCYAAYTIKLAKRENGSGLYILMQHGGGREVWLVPTFYDGGALAAHILEMPERLQFALLFSIYRTASEARRQAQEETRQTWAQAYVDGRIKKHRANKHRGARVEIIPLARVVEVPGVPA